MAEKSKRKGKPKFKVGQVVMRDDGPIKIENVGLHLYGQTGREQYLYGGGGKEAWEFQLHPLTKKEKGR